ncbi:MAG: 2-phosphosulfolactate phosphatase [Bacteroidota bacterium]
MHQLDVCLSPALLNCFSLEGKTAVIIDIFRATSCIVTGLSSGVEEIVPVATIEECHTYKAKGYLAAGERNGIKVKSFDLGNSPLGYLQPKVKGQKVVMTTTNGTKALNLSKEAKEIVIGAFLNFSAMVDYLKKLDRDVLLVCAGWHDKPNMEDTLYAGYLGNALQGIFSMESDSVNIALATYAESQKTDLNAYLREAAHYKRLVGRNPAVEEDLIFNLTVDKFSQVPVLEGEKLVVG